ncbi:MAG: sigma 54-interacting transcriptional regulator, partial [Desulfobacterales bacterium]|nr:sigma 54-interacting transcriptional regulator [Desulfobacterales bacterium]
MSQTPSYEELEKELAYLKFRLRQLNPEELFFEKCSDPFGTPEPKKWRWVQGQERAICSPGFYAMLGYGPDEQDPTPNIWIDYIHPEDNPVITRIMARAMESHRNSVQVAFRLRARGGTYYWTLCQGSFDDHSDSPQLSGYLSSISGKEDWQEAFEESQRRHQTLLQSLPGMAYRCRPVGHNTWIMEFVSDGCLELTGYSPKELMGNRKIYHSLIHEDDQPLVWDQISAALKGKRRYELVYRITTATDRVRWVWERGTGVFSNNRLICLEGFTLDITHHKTTEQTLLKENLRLKSMVKAEPGFGDIVGGSPAMQGVFELIESAATSSANVIIYGESGTGKELVAKAIHNRSARKEGQFVSVNCGAIPDSLLESEFFGCKKGAFTGATSDRPGFLERAHKGTLFLDEIGEINLAMQVKLLRAIEDGGFTPIGGQEVKRPDIRIISATNRNLEELVRRKSMRQDFFFRIHIVPIHLPPLRKRRSDIPLLIYHFLQKFSDDTHVATIPENLIRDMQNYHWPGNVRELQHMVQRYLTLRQVE